MTPTQKTSKNSPSFRKSLLTIAIATVLVAGCGGSNDDKTIAPTPTSIGGTAAKGIITDGIVTAYLLGSDGIKGAVVGTAMTDSVGSYSLETVSSYDGTSPLLLELTAGDDTTMVCDSYNDCGSVEHGDTIPLVGTDFMMTSVIPGTGSDTTVNAAITAFTSMAANSVVISGSVSDTSILETTSKINQVVGVNILETTPVNVASESVLGESSTDSQRYSIMLAALAAQAFSGTGSVEDMMTNLDAYSTDFVEDGDIGDEGGLSLETLYADANEAAEAAEDSLSDEAVDQISTLGSSVVGQLVDGVFEPEATSAENPSDVAQAKAFVTEVRTWVNAIQDLEDPANTFLDEADTLSNTLSSHSEDVLEVYAIALGAAINAIEDAHGADEDVPTTVDVIDDEDMLLGTLSIVDNSTSDTTEYVLTASDLSDSNVALETTISLNESLDTEIVSAGDTTAGINGTVSDDLVAITLSNAALTMGLSEDLPLGEDGPDAEFTMMSLAGELTVEALEAGVATGEMIAASAEVSLIAEEGSDGDMGLEKIALNNLSITNESGEVAGLTASLVVNNASTFNVFGLDDGEEETEENFADATISLSGKLNLADYGEAVLSITANRTDLDLSNLTATLGYDGKSLQLTAGANTEDETVDLALTFSNADGVAMVLEKMDGETDGTVTVGDSVVGTVDEDAIIRYNDGTFESL
ncbi:hypothetical protein [Leucothrix arctica]|uniref:Uncharacterized protein n=1 Tax=Leucothrix arctica TaxID=1481894 RepID=A0A317CBP1_9GAMM|nr:hypothetical protein [Leucothrix arctica]PWQ95541.1 hypothetical protein DKT75_12215 [Leucothrix arctica]